MNGGESGLLALLLLAASPAFGAPRPPVIATTEDSPRPYKVIGVVTVNVRPSFAWSKSPDDKYVLDKLADKGRKMGADAVVLVAIGRPHFTMTSTRTITAAGRAVVFTDGR